MSEGAKLARFLLALEVSPETHARFKKSPRRTMKKFGLSRATIEAVMSGEPKRVWRIFGGPIILSFHIAVVVGTLPKKPSRKPKHR